MLESASEFKGSDDSMVEGLSPDPSARTDGNETRDELLGGPVVSIATPARSARIAVYANGYARRRRDPAIERQVVACRLHARSTGGQVVGEYVDHLDRISDIHVSSAFKAMLRDAKAGLFEMLVIEDSDRLPRDLVNLDTLFHDLHRNGVVVHVAARGEISLAYVAIQGLLSEEYRRSMTERARFGRIRVAREGRFPSRPCFGYRLLPGNPGACVIDPSAATTVRRIFALRAVGMSLRAILGFLRADGVVDARGRDLTPGTLRSIMRNPRYVGLLMYNRRRSFVDPNSGRKRVCWRPRSEWIVTEVPGACIVDRPTWDQVQKVELADEGARRRRH